MEWTREVYEKSVSSRCWWYTPYDEGWEKSDLRKDVELRGIVAMELALGAVPEWARRIAERSINFLPGCGHYLYPQAFLEAVRAIGSETPPATVYSCYAVGRGRKEQIIDYCLCLDAWLACADPEEPARELTALGHRHVDWNAVCNDLWKVLGERTELKELLVQRMLHRMRWWVKSSSSVEDPKAVYCQDEYLGSYREGGCFAKDYGNPGLHGPGFREDVSRRVQRLEARVKLSPDWKWFRNLILDGWWPCAPKAFRFLERLLWSIGKERPAVSLPSFPLKQGEEVPGFLRCEDTYPDQDDAAEWWRVFHEGLQAWWRGEPLLKNRVADKVNHDLHEATQVKRWLVRLLVRKLELLAQTAEVGRLVTPRLKSRRGSSSLNTPQDC